MEKFLEKRFLFFQGLWCTNFNIEARFRRRIPESLNSSLVPK